MAIFQSQIIIPQPTIPASGATTLFTSTILDTLSDLRFGKGLAFVFGPGTLTGTGATLTFSLQGAEVLLGSGVTTWYDLPFTTAALGTGTFETVFPNWAARYLRVRIVKANADNTTTTATLLAWTDNRGVTTTTDP